MVEVSGNVVASIYKKLRKSNKNFIMYVSRSPDSKIVVYESIRQNDELLDLEIYNTYLEDLEKKEEVNTILKDEFFGTSELKQISRSKYTTTVNAMKDRKLTMNLKKSGRVVCTAFINGKKTHVLGVHMEMVFSSIGIPDLKNLVFYGIDMEIGVVEIERIPVSQDLKSEWDALSLFKKYMLSP
jgi:hypothetical protein